jgi:hypothetical protein
VSSGTQTLDGILHGSLAAGGGSPGAGHGLGHSSVASIDTVKRSGCRPAPTRQTSSIMTAMANNRVDKFSTIRLQRLCRSSRAAMGGKPAADACQRIRFGVSPASIYPVRYSASQSGGADAHGGSTQNISRCGGDSGLGRRRRRSGPERRGDCCSRLMQSGDTNENALRWIASTVVFEGDATTRRGRRARQSISAEWLAWRRAGSDVAQL